jgi:hypothetical protein
MLFLWGAPHESDPRFRTVVLPSGFSLVSTGESRWEVRDLGGYPRAVVTFSQARGAVPSILPIRRFSFSADVVKDRFRGVVSDWDSIVYRTPAQKMQSVALFMAKKWLDDYKPRWNSYISAVNFERRPAG